MKIDISVGGLAAHIQDQLREQGVMLPPDRASVWQGRSAALTNLRVAGVVTDAERDKIGARIAKAVAREVVPLPCDDEDAGMCDACDCWKATREACG
jgi:hypothetical protein